MRGLMYGVFCLVYEVAHGFEHRLDAEARGFWSSLWQYEV